MNGESICFEKKNLERVALDIIVFLEKWGLWRGVQILTNGKCYSFDENGELMIHEEIHPEGYTKGLGQFGCEGRFEWKDYSNPERLLDMTFEGPLSLLLRHGEYEVSLEDMSQEARDIIFADHKPDDVEEEIDELMNREYQWIDPDEFDSYVEWEQLTDYCEGEFDIYEEDIIRPGFKSDKKESDNLEFSSREEYEDFLAKLYTARESKVRDYLTEDADDDCYYSDTFYDDGHIADSITNEFREILEKYGLWYDLGFSWTLTTYRL